MKKILIAGADSYIGTSFEKWMSKWPDDYVVDTVDMIGDSWKSKEFSGYDIIFHVAGIAHVSADPEMEDLYYKVNRDLAIETAKKAKKEGVKQFIFMSSIIIYGKDSKIGVPFVIKEDTKYAPIDFYGDSKLQADLEIQKLSNDLFKTSIIRTPVVYGPNCKGNFPKLVKLAKKLPVFPEIKNERSMIYIDNLMNFIRLIIKNESMGVFYPQNKEYVSTSKVICEVRKVLNKKTVRISIFNPLIILVSKFVPYINKIFGNKVYSRNLETNDSYQIISFSESIALVIRGEQNEN